MRQGADHLIVPLTFLQAAHGENDGTLSPAECVARHGIMRGRLEKIAIGTWIEQTNALLRDIPLVEQYAFGVVAIGDQEARIVHHIARDEAELAARHHAVTFTFHRQLHFFAVHIADVRGTVPLLEQPGQPAFGQTTASMNLIDVVVAHEQHQTTQRVPVAFHAREAEHAQIFERKGHSLNPQIVGPIKDFLLRVETRGNQVLSHRLTPIDFPEPAAAAARFGRKRFGDQQG